jgi:glyoxylate/hydroxypyruvate reductase A
VSVLVPFAGDALSVIREEAGVDVQYHADLMPPRRYPADHGGDPGFRREPEDERRWLRLLAGTTIALGVPGDGPDGLRHLVESAPELQWVQATASGAGEQLRRAAINRRQLDSLIVTTGAGAHAQPLAEFALFGLLALAKGARRLIEDQRGERWPEERRLMTQLSGRRVLVLGYGAVGQATGRLLSSVGMTVSAVTRTGTLQGDGGVLLYATHDLDRALAETTDVVVALPGTPETEGLLGARRLALLPADGMVVNVGRGTVIDEEALADAISAGRLAGAALDVFAEEPLSKSSRLWGLEKVLISPHTASLSADQDLYLARLFVDNLARFRCGNWLRNRVDVDAWY